MKHLLIVLAITVTVLNASAQAWEANSKVLSIGGGISQFAHIDDYYYSYNDKHIRSWYSPRTGQLNFQGEFGIHKYWGLGFTTGMGGRQGWNSNYDGEVNFPIGMLTNFHLYQLISDKAGSNIHADKLDIYIGAALGTGVALTYYPYSRRAVPLGFFGVYTGIRYYFVPNVALNAELGFGKSIVNLGFAFKI